METVNLLMTFSLFAPVALLVAGQLVTFRAAGYPRRQPFAASTLVEMRRFEAVAANDAELRRAA